MCGIVGATARRQVPDILLEGLRRLEYRGYDSAGLVVIDSQEKLQLHKALGKVVELENLQREDPQRGITGIAHTRWATHGEPSTDNAHPHVSCGNVALVHNGIIENYEELRAEVEPLGYQFSSGTDTEVVVHLIHHALKSSDSLMLALQEVTARLEGAFAIAAVSSAEPDVVVGARRGSPLVVGVGIGENFLASDPLALRQVTDRFIYLEDGDLVTITPDKVEISHAGEVVERPIERLGKAVEYADRGGYSHYMLKEIYEQPQTISNALDLEPSGLDDVVEMFEKAESSYFLGVGTTFYVAIYAQYIFSELAQKFIAPISSDEFLSLANVDKKTLVFAMSQSGETFDTLSALKFSQAKGAKTAAVVNVMGSSIARMVDKVILQGSGPEICVISTKAALSQMVVLTLLGMKLGLKKKVISKKAYQENLKSLKELPAIIQGVLNERSGFIHRIANKYCKNKNWLYLGRGIYYPIALEAALKMKEVAYVHAEGMPGGFLKHGTLAMIDDDISSIVFVPPKEKKELYQSTVHSIEEIRARSGFVLGIHFTEQGKNQDLFSEELILPNVPTLIAPLIQLVIGQLFAYFTATSLKRNVDKPRSLAKSVTVG